jgi:hypothetical protein
MGVLVRSVLHPGLNVIVNGSIRRQTICWVMLIALTLLSAGILRNLGYLIGIFARVAALVLIMFVKARIIGLDYMELRKAPLPLRAAFEAWLLIVCFAILVLNGGVRETASFVHAARPVADCSGESHACKYSGQRLMGAVGSFQRNEESR